MPKIPEYFSQTQAASGAPTRRASGEEFGAGIGRAVGQVANVIGDTGNLAFDYEKRKAEREATAYTSKAISEIQLRSLNSLTELQAGRNTQTIESYSEDFQKLYDESLKAASDNAPNELAKLALQDRGLEVRTNLVAKANQYQANTKTKLYQNDSIDAVNNLTNSVTLDPDNFQLYAKQAAAIVDSASVYMDATELQKFREQSLDGMASAKIKAEININPNTAEALMGKEEFKNSISPATFQSLTNQINSEKQRRIKEEAALREKKLKLFMEDPAALAITEGADQNSPADVVAKQKQLGVMPDNIAIIPKQQASLLSHQLSGIDNSDQMIAELDKIKKQYGDEYYHIAMKDLKKNGLSSDAAFIALIDPLRDKDVIDASFAIGKTGEKEIAEMARDRAAANNDEYLSIGREVSNNFAEIAGTLQAEGMPPAEVANIYKRMSNTANYFYQKGDDIETSVARATNWLTSRYQLADVNGHKIRIPEDFTGSSDKIETGLSELLNELDLSDIKTEITSNYTLDTLKERGRFVLNTSEDGYNLVDELGVPVRNKSGTLLEYTLPVVLYIGQDIETGGFGKKQRQKLEAIKKRNKEIEEQNLRNREKLR